MMVVLVLLVTLLIHYNRRHPVVIKHKLRRCLLTDVSSVRVAFRTDGDISIKVRRSDGFLGDTGESSHGDEEPVWSFAHVKQF